MTESLIIKDGSGTTKNLTVESGSYGYIPVHDSYKALTGVNNVIPDYFFQWIVDPTDGTTTAASNDPTRKGLMIFNPGPYNIYIGLATDDVTPFPLIRGFAISGTSSAPDRYSFILYPSGTYIADSSTVSLYHGIYVITGSVPEKIFVTETF